MIQQAYSFIFGGITIYHLVVIGLVILFGRLVWKANRDPKINFDWIDLITSIDQTTGKQVASATKIFQLVGGIAGTFIVTKLTLEGKLTSDIFGVYLAYVGGIAGFHQLMMAKYGVNSGSTPPPLPSPALPDIDNGNAKPPL